MIRGIPFVDRSGKLDSVPGELTPEVKRRSLQLLKAFDDSIVAGVRATAAGDYCRFSVKFNGLATNISSINRLASLSRLLFLAAFMAQDQGAGPDTVFAYLLSANRCARMFDGFPAAAGCIARSYTTIRAQTLAVTLVGETDFTEKQLQLLATEISLAGDYPAARISFIGERTIGIQAYEDTDATLDEIKDSWPIFHEMAPTDASKTLAQLPSSTLQKMKRVAAANVVTDSQLFSESMDRVLGIADKPYLDSYSELTRLEAELQSDERAAELSHKGMLMFMLLPQLEIAKAMEMHAEAINQMASALLAIRLFQKRTGDFPQASSDLIPRYLAGPPVDPWTGNKFTLRREDNLYEFRSAGTNQQLDGDSADSDDLVVTLAL